MHIEKVQQGATAHVTEVILSKNGASLEDAPDSCVLRFQTDPADNATVVERTLSMVSKSRWAYQWTEDDFTDLPTNVEMPAQVVATNADESLDYYPQGDPLGTDGAEGQEHLKIIIYPSLAEPA